MQHGLVLQISMENTVLEIKRAQELARSDQSERDCLYNLQASMSCSSGGVRVVAK